MGNTKQDGYLKSFPNFEEDLQISIVEEFSRLAINQGWGADTSKFKNQRKQYFKAVYEAYLGSVENGLQDEKLKKLQKLCEDLKVSPVPDSITKCKKALKGVHVNLIDLIDSRRQGKQVRIFSSYRALQKDMKKSNKFFPLECAKAIDAGLLKILLEKVF